MNARGVSGSWLAVAFIGLASALSPVFGGRDLNDPHNTVQLIVTVLIFAFAFSQALPSSRGAGRAPVALLVAFLGLVYAVLPWSVVETSAGALAQFHDNFHVVLGTGVAALAGWNIFGASP